MKKALFNIYVRVILKRVKDGEVLEDVINSYTSLSEEDRQLLINEIITILNFE